MLLKLLKLYKYNVELISNIKLSSCEICKEHGVLNNFEKKCYSALIFNRPGVAGAVLQSPSLLINSFIESVSHPFPPNLQNNITPKSKELGS